MNKPRRRNKKLALTGTSVPVAIVRISNLEYDSSWVPRDVTGDFDLINDGGGKISQQGTNYPLVVKEPMNIVFTIADSNFYFAGAPIFEGDGKKNKKDDGSQDFEPQATAPYSTSATVYNKRKSKGNSGDYSWKIYINVRCPDGCPGRIDPDVENDN